MSVQKCMFFLDLHGLTEVFGRCQYPAQNFLFGLIFVP